MKSYAIRRFLPLALLATSVTAHTQPDYSVELWKVSSSTGTVYVLGSIHIAKGDMYPLPKPIEENFAASSILLVESTEVGRQKMSANDLAPGLPKDKAFYPEGDSLWNHVSDDVHKRLVEFCDKNDLDIEMVGKARPWVVVFLLGIAPGMNAGQTADLGIDHHFMEEARKSGKHQVGIETQQSQMDLVSGFSDDLQVKWLEAALGIQVEGLDPVYAKLIAQRNARMANAAERYLKNRSTAFLVVGSGHVSGKDGILELLKKRGYKVDLVPLTK